MAPEQPSTPPSIPNQPSAAEGANAATQQDDDSFTVFGVRLGVGTVAFVGFMLFVGIGALSNLVDAINKSDMAAASKGWAKAGLGVGITALVVAGAALLFRHSAFVRRTMAGFWLVLSAILVSIIPIYFLGPTDRVLLLKLGAIVVLSLFPGFLYLQFIVARGDTLLEEFVRNLNRLRIDRPENLPTKLPNGRYDPDNLYIRKFEGHYGRVAVRGADADGGRQSHVRGEGMLPVVFLTLLLAVGWTLVLQPETIRGVDLLPKGFSLSGRPLLPTDVLRFGFLGSYFFIVQMLIRRWFQDDLRTSAYINASARVNSVALLVIAINLVWKASAATEQALAFIIGVFPQVGLQALQRLIAFPLQGIIPSLKRKYPLDELDGLDVWYESRLLEEGIEDMQNLATANLVDVMLRTRVPAQRLVDWLDQAILCLRVRDDDETDAIPSSRARLRTLGIRTATDLEEAFRPPADAQQTDEQQARERDRIEQLGRVLNSADAGNLTPSVTQTILQTLDGEPNLYHVRAWKEYWRQVDLVRLERRPATAASANS